MLRFRWGALLVVAAVSGGCGARTGLIDDEFDAGERPEPMPEECNGLDDDLDESVDEDFRDDIGRYLHDDHCGACGDPCRPIGANVVEAHCALIDENPFCAAVECTPGFAPSISGRCVPAFDRLCLECADDGDCGAIASARCANIGGERRCSVGCELGCPLGYACGDDGLCVPMGGSCTCEPGESFTVACAIETEEDPHCVGHATCDDGVLSMCAGDTEVCDEVDNDCNGVVDDPYRDARGAYILDIHNCGECGVDCTESTIPEGDLVCGGDPFAPTCVLHCPDTDDGIQPGDRVDGDRDIATGCECIVTSLSDVPGPVGASGADLDVNCDGADGIVVESFYVAPDGDDGGPGSPTRPLRTLEAAMRRASESLDSDAPRPHVFIASGSYVETLEVPDGVKVHGGYRRDYLSLQPDGFRVEIRAPAGTIAPGGAALVVRGAGTRETVVEWVSVRGRDAAGASSPAFGAYLRDPGPNLALRQMEVRSGSAGAGMPGPRGMAGATPMRPAADGAPPRGAVEDASHTCVGGASNVVAGGEGGRNVCDGADVRGGTGGSPACPRFADFQPAGARGNDAGSVRGGSGGTGGQDSEGPISGPGCPSMPICCGLADFTVPTEFTGPQSGAAGADGSSGTAGRGCADALGTFDGETWTAATATNGTSGRPGSGGGGGGGGGGTVMNWMFGVCEFADGLGGGGGGGGAGGCGGVGGGAGTSGGPSVAILVHQTRGAVVPAIEGVLIAPGAGGRGGDGGAGGDGALGGQGGFGGTLSRDERSTPTLAGPFPGGRGGKGGNGGPGGGGGGGCGGGSVGVWVTGLGGREPPGVARWRMTNTFRLGPPGVAGRGGGGEAPAADGEGGGAVDVVVR